VRNRHQLPAPEATNCENADRRAKRLENEEKRSEDDCVAAT
jgi:hypothetical protein